MPSSSPDLEPTAVASGAGERLPAWLVITLVALVLVRVGYHCAYLIDVPFSLATFSDGRLYEQSARDLLDAPPWGREAFYLQGLYAYQLALPMLIRPWLSLGLLLQLVLAGLALWGLYRATAPLLGRRDAALGLALVLAHPGLSFYENKYLTASLAVVTMVMMLLALARLQRRPSAGALVVLGLASGLAVLARGNMLLAIPGVAVAAVLADAPRGRRRMLTLAWLALGLMLALGPMALRNQVVTGRPSIMPVHGGGTSFYIGNNRHARGVWNNAGGLLSGEVVHERQELAAQLGVPPGSKAEQAAAIGRALYGRALVEIAEDPARWLSLELRKAWLLLGNDELSQDYDVAGERELLPWWCGRGLPFSAMLGLGLAGFFVVRRRIRSDPELAARWRPWGWMLGAQALAVLAANLLFFTSAQHRLPLLVPLAVLLGPGLIGLVRGPRSAAPGDRRAWALVWAGVLLLLAQGAWPRQRHEGPTPEHYYNLAIAHVQLGQPQEAVAAFDRAVQHRPDHPVILIERATLNRRLGHLDAAADDLQRLASLPDVPPWIERRVDDEWRRVEALRQLEDPRAQEGGATQPRRIP